MLELVDVSVVYGASYALRDANLYVDAGEIVALIGANGAGKSTTLSTVIGWVQPRAGEVLFNGSPITRWSPQRRVARGIAICPEGRQVFADMTVDENLRLGAYLRTDPRGVAEDLERAFALFPRLKERLAQKAGTLSGGEQEMLAIARALMSRPHLLLLDEPSLGLAPMFVERIFEQLAAIRRQGTTLLLVEQNAAQALALADRAYVLEAGRIVLAGEPGSLAQDPAVRAAYLGGA